MQIKKLENELSEYVSEWLDARWQHWFFVYKSIHRDRRTGIYKLKQGEKLLDYPQIRNYAPNMIQKRK